MNKLKEELRKSKRYEYIDLNEANVFTSHTGKFGFQFIKEAIVEDGEVIAKKEYIDIVFYDKLVPEGFVVARIDIQISLEDLEKIVGCLKEK